MDEDDEIPGVGYADFLQEHQRQFDDDGDELPDRSRRRTAFNDELEIGEMRIKG